MDDKELEKRAIDAILKNIAKVPEKTLRAATRYIPPSSSKPPKVIPNKQFLGSTIKSVLSHNERVEREEQRNSSKALKDLERNKTMERFKGRARSKTRSRSRSRTKSRYRCRDARKARSRSRSLSRDRSRRKAHFHEDYNGCDIPVNWSYGPTFTTNPSLAILSNPEVNMMFRNYFYEFAESGTSQKKKKEIATIDLTKSEKKKKSKKRKRKKSKKKKRRKSSSSSSSSSSETD
ncbi:hypothetical protein ACFFRR_003095 [Megaselia abdita]